MKKADLKVMIVDDEPDILEFLSFALAREGYQVETAADGMEAYSIALKYQPHLFILDIMMPQMDGVELCAKLREHELFQDSLIAFLTAKSGDDTEVEALDMGADDYIHKPIKPKVFVSRINALTRRLRKKKTNDAGAKNFGRLIINHEKFEVKLDGVAIALARKEFELLRLLTTKPGKVFSRQEILNKVWGVDVIVVDRTVDVHVRKLRGKIGSEFIKTLKGVGYKFTF